MDNRQRFRRVMSSQAVDRLPLIEWASWWDLTIKNWHQQGLPEELTDSAAIREFLGLDHYRQFWIRPDLSKTPKPAFHGAPRIRGAKQYGELRQAIFPKLAFDPEAIGRWAEPHSRGELVVWITLDGFFWVPRALLGIEPHLYAFYDQPELIHQINEDLLEFNLRQLEHIGAILRPDFMTVAEDMSYNRGPMISRELFDEFLAPYYRRLIPYVKQLGIITFIDSDGDITEMVPWFESVGVDGFLPLERRAGVDINLLRRKHPRLRMIGGVDKTVLHLGEQAIRQELERLFPVMCSGRYIPSVDHQTPPNVTLRDYQLYLQVLREYCAEAGPLIGARGGQKRQ